MSRMPQEPHKKSCHDDRTSGENCQWCAAVSSSLVSSSSISEPDSWSSPPRTWTATAAAASSARSKSAVVARMVEDTVARTVGDAILSDSLFFGATAAAAAVATPRHVSRKNIQKYASGRGPTPRPEKNGPALLPRSARGRRPSTSAVTTGSSRFQVQKIPHLRDTRNKIDAALFPKHANRQAPMKPRLQSKWTPN